MTALVVSKRTPEKKMWILLSPRFVLPWILALASLQTYSIPDRGVAIFRTLSAASTQRVGYARIQPQSGDTTPVGLAILGLRQNGVLVTEAAIPATPVTQSGRIYAEVDGAVNTGVAIANVSDADTDVRISFFFTDQNGNDFGHGSLTVGAKQQIAAFLNQSPFNVAAPVRGTFTFTSSLPISAVGFRGFTNELGEFLITTLPMASITSPSVENLNFPQFVDGGGWSTQVILVNPTSVSLTGTVHLYNTSGTESSPAGGMPYSIAPRSYFVLRTNDPEKPIEVKSVQVRSNQGQVVPSGLVLFSFTNRGITVAETGVGPAAAGTAFRLYVENADDSAGRSAIQTGIAIANPSPVDPASVRIEAFARDGNSTGATTTITIPAFGQMSAFVNQILASVPREFQGVLRITASVPIAVVGLRGRRNERGDFLTTSTPPADETKRASSEQFIFPQIVDGGGYFAELILMSGSAGQVTSGIIQFLAQTGTALDISLQPTP